MTKIILLLVIGFTLLIFNPQFVDATTYTYTDSLFIPQNGETLSLSFSTSIGNGLITAADITDSVYSVTGHLGSEVTGKFDLSEYLYGYGGTQSGYLRLYVQNDTVVDRVIAGTGDLAYSQDETVAVGRFELWGDSSEGLHISHFYMQDGLWGPGHYFPTWTSPVDLIPESGAVVDVWSTSVDPSQVPEPSSIFLVATGLGVGLSATRKWSRR